MKQWADWRMNIATDKYFKTGRRYSQNVPSEAHKVGPFGDSSPSGATATNICKPIIDRKGNMNTRVRLFRGIWTNHTPLSLDDLIFEVSILVGFHCVRWMYTCVQITRFPIWTNRRSVIHPTNTGPVMATSGLSVHPRRAWGATPAD